METRQFKMHKNLLMDVIKGQAGTVEKAWLEAIMNSIDAGAKKINVTIIDEKNLSVIETKRLRWIRKWNSLYMRGSPRAWTDGTTYIVINKKELSIPYKEWVITVPSLLIHEYCHEDDNDETDVHGEVFYENFHKMLFNYIPKFLSGIEKIIIDERRKNI